MNTNNPMFKTIARLLIAVMWVQPLQGIAANLQVDQQAGGNTHITAANNGVPVINIATPNGKGLSHNKFTDYNVDQQGLILNNSTDKLTQTQLGGIIFGNSQLKGRAANTILNEVTGGQRSQLKGYTEVAGQKAHVIVANPHGITCDGCGFINTPHATLTTGKPILEQGRLQGYDVDDGDIEIAGAGLNATNISRFDLITRSAKINAELHANDLNIITGRNQVDARNLAVSVKTDQVDEQPLLAIDSSALGGMYAGAIRLVGTEAGVGVKLAGDMAASAGDIHIDARGKLVMVADVAARNISIKTQSLQNSANQTAEKSLQIHAQQLENLSGGVLGSAGEGKLQVQQLQNQHGAKIVSDAGLHISGQQLENHGDISSGQDLQIESQERLTNFGAVVASANLSLEASEIHNEAALLFAGQDMKLSVDKLSNQQADIFALGDITISGYQGQARTASLENLSGTVEAGDNLYIQADEVLNRRSVLDIFAGKYYASIRELSCGQPYPTGDCKLGSNGRRNAVWELTERDKLEVLDSTPAAALLSGSDLFVEANLLLNSSSRIAAGGNMQLELKQLDNIGIQPMDMQLARVFVSGRKPDYYHYAWLASSFNSKHRDAVQQSSIQGDLSRFVSAMQQEYLPARKLVETPLADAGYSAILQAGGNIEITAEQNLVNSVIRPSFSYVSGGVRDDSNQTSGRYSSIIHALGQLPAEQRQQQVDSVAYFGLVDGSKLFRLAAEHYNGVSAGNHPFLIETNPLLTDMRQYLSSDYLLEELGLSPENMQKRLGDGLFEQRLLREAWTARTGQRFIAGIHSDEAIYRYLMDNAIASKEALNLSVGISLSAEQVAALTHDIVWMEEREVQGEQVLVPVLYMAQAKGRLAPNGALLQGQDLTLFSGGDLSNQGTLKAGNNLTAYASTLSNSGLIHAGEHLSLLAEDSIYNRQGGILAGRDVDLTAHTGDILNERTVTHHESALGNSRWESSFADSAARIEAANGLSLTAGRDVLNLGGVLNSGDDMQITADRDVSLSSVEEHHSISRGSHYLNSQTTQLISETVAGGNLMIDAGRDLTAVASRIESGQHMQLIAGNDLTLASAANESHHYSKSKKATNQRDQVRQVGTEVNSGGSFAAVSGNDLTIVSSSIAANDEAYLVAGGKVQLLAAQDYDYSFSEKKKKGSFGRKSFKSDERTHVAHIGSSITSGGDLAIISGDEQRYQAAQLTSDADLTLDSGAGIVFEGVKDLEQQSRIRSKNSWVWQSAKGKGHTDETLMQSQLQAQGEIAIRAAERIQIDIKEVNQQSVSQTIDAMVQADPQLAWLKDMEQRGDVDWHQVKELHDSFKYSSSGLSGPAAMVIAIVVAYFTAGAASGLIGAAANATAGSAMAAGTAATAATATTVGTAATAAGWGNVALSAVAASAASNTAVSTINNKGNLGIVLKDVTSSDSLKGYAVTGITAGLTTGVYDKWTSTQTGASNTASVSNNTGVLANSGNVALEGAQGLNSWSGVGQFAANQALQNSTSAVLNKALGQDGSFGDALTTTLANTFAAAGFNWVGDFSQSNQIENGSLSKIGLHAIMGGLAAEAAGGDFKTGALVAGANEALIDTLANQYDNMAHDQRSGLLTMNSQVLGVLVASAAGGDEKDMQIGASVAGNATKYNWDLHLPQDMMTYGQAASSLTQHMQEQGVTPEEISSALHAMARGDGFSGPDPAKEFVKAWAMFMLTGGGMLSTTSRGVTLVVGGSVSGGSNLVYQLSTKELNDLSFTDTSVATAVGALTQGKGLIGTVGVSMGGGYVKSQINGTDAQTDVVSAGVGSAAGFGVTKAANKIFPHSVPDKVKSFLASIFGGYVSESVGDNSNVRVGEK